MVKTYRIKSLINGSFVDSAFRGMTLIAVPRELLEEFFAVRVVHEKEEMLVSLKDKPLKEIMFEDKFGRDKKYTLCYYEWRPMAKQERLI